MINSKPIAMPITTQPIALPIMRESVVLPIYDGEKDSQSIGLQG
jgi:hypothetical protein